jgi:hypothetical protein
MDVDKAEGEGGRSDDGIKRARRSAVKCDHAVDQRSKIIGPGADMARDGHARFAVMLSDETAFLSQS